MKCFVVVAVLLTGIQGALTIRCYECSPSFTNLSSANLCSNPTDTIDCTDPPHDSCLSISITGLRGNTSDIAESTFHSLNCTTKFLCDEIKNFACDLLNNETSAPGVKLENCEISCCQGDLCNKPLGGPSASSFPRITPPAPSGSITIKKSMGSMNFPLNCALFGILSVIPIGRHEHILNNLF